MQTSHGRQNHGWSMLIFVGKSKHFYWFFKKKKKKNSIWQNLQCLSAQKDTPSPHHSHSFVPFATVFPHRCAEGMERMCCCVGLRFACSFSCPVLHWFQQRRLQLQSPLKSLLNSPTLWHTSFRFSPRTCGMPFPKTAYQQTVWHQWTKLIFFLSVSSLTGTMVLCIHLYIWSECLQCFSVRALHDIILCICCRAML